MTDDAEPPLTGLLDQILFALREPLDFTLTDTRSTLNKVRLLAAAATYFNVVSVADFGGRAGPVRAAGMVEQVIGAAFQTFGGVDPHPDPFSRAAMLLRGITQGHPFNDGNKRTGFLTAAYFLEQVGHPVPEQCSPEAVIAMCMRVSAGEVRDVEEIAAELRRLWGSSSSPMR